LLPPDGVDRERSGVATTDTKEPGTVVQAWVPPALAAQIKARADDERRSVSAVIRLALEDALRRGRAT
jgi:Ribbon-helix-helix protein, copG family